MGLEEFYRMSIKRIRKFKDRMDAQKKYEQEEIERSRHSAKSPPKFPNRKNKRR